MDIEELVKELGLPLGSWDIPDNLTDEDKEIINTFRFRTPTMNAKVTKDSHLAILFLYPESWLGLGSSINCDFGRDTLLDCQTLCPEYQVYAVENPKGLEIHFMKFVNNEVTIEI